MVPMAAVRSCVVVRSAVIRLLSGDGGWASPGVVGGGVVCRVVMLVVMSARDCGPGGDQVGGVFEGSVQDGSAVVGDLLSGGSFLAYPWWQVGDGGGVVFDLP